MIKNMTEILNYLKNHTWKETANYFKISEMSISRLIKKQDIKKRIELYDYVSMLTNIFKKLINKPLVSMKATELRIIYSLLTGKNVSKTKKQYLRSINIIIKNRAQKVSII